MHTTWCDGKNTPEEMVAAALEKGFGAIGFSSHALLPISDPWTLQPDEVLEIPSHGMKNSLNVVSAFAVAAAFFRNSARAGQTSVRK